MSEAAPDPRSIGLGSPLALDSGGAGKQPVTGLLVFIVTDGTMGTLVSIDLGTDHLGTDKYVAARQPARHPALLTPRS